MTDTESAIHRHRCHALGCEVDVPPRMFMCLRHWRMVPKRMQAAIWGSYRPGQEVDKQPSAAYLKAASEAIGYVAAGEERRLAPSEEDRMVDSARGNALATNVWEIGPND